MIDTIFIIIAVIGIGLFGGLLYLLYVPFKKRLIKSGKLTAKLNQQINWTFILTLGLAGIVLYSFKDYRTSSKARLEKISDINLPPDFEVIKDEYQDMMQDYCILYEIQFDNKSSKELTSNIKKSKHFNLNAFHKAEWKETDFITVDTVKAVWSKSPKGYDFNCENRLTTYSIELDTVKKTLKYLECAD